MIAPLALALAALAAAPSKPPAPLDCGKFTCRLFDTPQQAFAPVLASKPRVLGVGEYHEIEGGPKVPSAIKRFVKMMPLLKGNAADLVAETWITNGKCGKVEKAATEQIEKTTERPATTEDEVVTLLKTANANGLSPHILKVECEDYEALFDDQGEVDNVKLLELVTRLLEEKAEELLEKLGPKSEQAVVLYGGAIHNDLKPAEGLESFSFAQDLKKATGGRYVQLGLYVPEFMEQDDEAKKSEWFPYFQKHVSTRKTLLIELSPDAFLLIFPRAPKPAPKPKK